MHRPHDLLSASQELVDLTGMVDSFDIKFVNYLVGMQVSSDCQKLTKIGVVSNPHLCVLTVLGQMHTT